MNLCRLIRATVIAVPPEDVVYKCWTATTAIDSSTLSNSRLSIRPSKTDTIRAVGTCVIDNRGVCNYQIAPRCSTGTPAEGIPSIATTVMAVTAITTIRMVAVNKTVCDCNIAIRTEIRTSTVSITTATTMPIPR